MFNTTSIGDYSALSQLFGEQLLNAKIWKDLNYRAELASNSRSPSSIKVDLLLTDRLFDRFRNCDLRESSDYSSDMLTKISVEAQIWDQSLTEISDNVLHELFKILNYILICSFIQFSKEAPLCFSYGVRSRYLASSKYISSIIESFCRSKITSVIDNRSIYGGYLHQLCDTTLADYLNSIPNISLARQKSTPDLQQLHLNFFNCYTWR